MKLPARRTDGTQGPATKKERVFSSRPTPTLLARCTAEAHPSAHAPRSPFGSQAVLSGVPGEDPKLCALVFRRDRLFRGKNQPLPSRKGTQHPNGWHPSCDEWHISRATPIQGSPGAKARFPSPHLGYPSPCRASDTVPATRFAVVCGYSLWSPEALSLTPGSHLGPYEILDLRGAGGMGNTVGNMTSRSGT